MFLSQIASYKEARKYECWIKAINSELGGLKHNETWNSLDHPHNIQPIGRKWVYKVNHKANGTIERYKARLVTKGYNQVEGLDLFDTCFTYGEYNYCEDTTCIDFHKIMEFAPIRCKQCSFA